MMIRWDKFRKDFQIRPNRGFVILEWEMDGAVEGVISFSDKN